MTVNDLSKEQFEELKSSYYYKLFFNGFKNSEEYYCPNEIPDKLVKEYYADTYFVNDDFCCSCGH